MASPSQPAVAAQAVVQGNPDAKENATETPSPKATEGAPTEVPVHDVPVQSHHRSSISIKSVTKSDQLADSVKAVPAKDRRESFTLEQINEAILRYAE